MTDSHGGNSVPWGHWETSLGLCLSCPGTLGAAGIEWVGVREAAQDGPQRTAWPGSAVPWIPCCTPTGVPLQVPAQIPLCIKAPSYWIRGSWSQEALSELITPYSHIKSASEVLGTRFQCGFGGRSQGLARLLSACRAPHAPPPSWRVVHCSW